MSKRRLMGEINVVPYIDVMLVLLIIFMVTAPLLTQGVDVDLPQADAEIIENVEAKEPLILSIDRDGRYFLNVGDDEDEPIESDVVEQYARLVLKRDADRPVLVRADQSVPHGTVVQAMVVLQRAGAAKVGIVTEQPES